MQDSQIIRTEYSDVMKKVIYRLCNERNHCQSPAGCKRRTETSTETYTLTICTNWGSGMTTVP